MIDRRAWLYRMGMLAGVAAKPRIFKSPVSAEDPEPKRKPLDISEYAPKSMLRVPETMVARSKFPVIDIHTHLSWSRHSENGISLSAEREYPELPEELLQVMDRKNIRAMVNLTGGFDRGLAEAVKKYDRAMPGRFYTFTEPAYSRFKEPNYPKNQAETIEQAHRDGALTMRATLTHSANWAAVIQWVNPASPPPPELALR